MIRHAIIADLPRLEPLAIAFYAASEHLQVFDLEKFTATWTGLLNSEGAAILVSEVDGRIVGALGCIAHRDLYSEKQIASEMFWFVLPAFRGAGLRLYRAFEGWARSRGCDEIRMMALADSMPGKVEDFYGRMGFRIAERLYSKPLALQERSVA